MQVQEGEMTLDAYYDKCYDRTNTKRTMLMVEFKAAVEAASNVAKLGVILKDAGLDEEIDIKGMKKDDAKDEIMKWIDENPDYDFDAEDEDDTEDESEDESEDDAAEDADDAEGDDETPKAKRNDKKKSKTIFDIVKEMKKDPNRDMDFITRKIVALNSLVDEAGEYGDYKRGSATLETPIDGYVLDENGIDYEPGETNVIYFITSSLIRTLRDTPALSSIYNKVREDENILYTILAGCEVDLAVEYVPANTEWVNPFSAARHPEAKVYDHDLAIATIYGIKKLGPDGEFWMQLSKLGNNPHPNVVLALMAKRDTELAALERKRRAK